MGKLTYTNVSSLTWFDQHLESVFVRPLWKIQCLGYGATWAQLRRSLWHMRQKVHVKGASFSSLLNRDIIRKWGKSWEGRSRQWCGIDYGVCCYSQLGSLIPSVYHVTFCALLVINIIFCWNLQTVLSVAIQLLTRIEFIHSKHLIYRFLIITCFFCLLNHYHGFLVWYDFIFVLLMTICTLSCRDVKPENFLIGRSVDSHLTSFHLSFTCLSSGPAWRRTRWCSLWTSVLPRSTSTQTPTNTSLTGKQI